MNKSRSKGWWTCPSSRTGLQPSYYFIFSKPGMSGSSVLLLLPGAEMYHFCSPLCAGCLHKYQWIMTRSINLCNPEKKTVLPATCLELHRY